jgi:pimeloyl-ACP methyl ester carboxylesterase
LRLEDDLFEDTEMMLKLAFGRQLWDASLIRVPTLILRSERDFWSRSQDAEVLAEQLVHAPYVRKVTLPDATHYVHLDRPERGRNVFLKEVVSFLAEGA